MEQIRDFTLTFSSILWEALPFIVLGAVIAGILEELLPQRWITRILPRTVLPAVIMGALLGLAFPMCECGIVVVMRRLLRKGLPLSCCIAYMLAGPIINLIVIFSTYVAFKNHGIAPEMIGLRVGLGFIVAVVTALIVQTQYARFGNSLLKPLATPPPAKAAPRSLTVVNGESASREEPESKEIKKSLMDRIGNISSTAIHDFVDISVFLILGALLAALAKQQISPGDIEVLSVQYPFLAIPAMMLLSFLMCLCSEADAFVAASFTSMHISAKVAFLVMGPMLDLKLILMYTRVFRPRLILTIATSVTVLVLFLCSLVHIVYQLQGWSGLPASLG